MAMLQITPDTLIADLVAAYPNLTKILVDRYGFHCVGCFASEFETLAEGAIVHGLTQIELLGLINELQLAANPSDTLDFKPPQ